MENQFYCMLDAEFTRMWFVFQVVTLLPWQHTLTKFDLVQAFVVVRQVSLEDTCASQWQVIFRSIPCVTIEQQKQSGT